MIINGERDPRYGNMIDEPDAYRTTDRLTGAALAFALAMLIVAVAGLAFDRTIYCAAPSYTQLPTGTTQITCQGGQQVFVSAGGGR